MEDLQALFDAHLFQFEQDKYYPLRRIPLAIRIKLDRCGIKLILRDWVKFSREEREELLGMPCTHPPEVAAFAERLKVLIAAAGGDQNLTVSIPEHPPWEEATQVPAAIRDYLTQAGLPPLTTAQWAGLSELQRFALCKLTRAGHDNKNLLPALREFGLPTAALTESTMPGGQANAKSN